jgi:hypothetical protein
MASLLDFCRIYLASAFPWAFSDDQKKVARKIENAVTVGGNFAEAMPRGSGKSTLCEAACLWAGLKGLRKFIALIAAVGDFGTGMVDSINSTLENNDILLEDFPEVVFPFRALEQSNNRAKGQRCNGQLTLIGRTAGMLIFPTIAGSQSSGVVIVGTGIEGGKLRGLRHKLKDGSILRPDMIIGDDLQTDESAYSPVECGKREKAITGKILGMAGPGMTPAAVVCGTVIRKGDVMDNLLDRQKHPDWQGERMKMIYAFPTRTDLWDEYAQLLKDDLARDGDGSPARSHYRRHRQAMDAGGEVAWIARKSSRDVSALEHAMKLLIRDRETFFSEYQNEPIPGESIRRPLTADQIAHKINGLARGTIPKTAEYVTAYIDVHKRLLYYVVSAWSDPLAGTVIDYGTYPKQPLRYFAQATAPKSMESKTMSMDAWLHAGLEALTNTLLAATFIREDDAEFHIGKLLIDARWGEANALVKQFCRRHPQAGRTVWAAQGYGSGSIRKPPLHTLPPKEGMIDGRVWRILPPTDGNRWVTIDTNACKSLVAARLAMPVATAGGIELFGSEPREHALFADHCISEAPQEITAAGLTYDAWEWLMPHADNHWWDCLVGSMVGALSAGCHVPEWGKPRRAPQRSPTAPRVQYL